MKASIAVSSICVMSISLGERERSEVMDGDEISHPSSKFNICTEASEHYTFLSLL